MPQIYFLLSVRKGVVSAVLEPKFHGTILFSPGFANKTCDCVVKTITERPQAICGHRLTLRLCLEPSQTSSISHFIAEFPDLTLKTEGWGISKLTYSPKESDISLELFWVQIRNSFHMFHVMQQVLNTVLLSQAFNHWFFVTCIPSRNRKNKK